MDFTLNKEHEMARQLFRDFAENEVKPLAQEVDEEERFPRETVVFRQGEDHRDTHTENEKRIDEVGRRTTVPARVPQRRVNLSPGAGIVDDAHKGHGQAAQDVEGYVTFFHTELELYLRN